VTERPTAHAADLRTWTLAEKFDDWSLICCRKPHLDLLSDPEEFSLTHRVARLGPVALAETIVGSDLSMDCAELCDAFRVVVLVSGHMECVHRGVSVCPPPGSAAVCAPDGLSGA
jgi:hypothetical protein